MKIAEETNMTITKIEGTILKVSINNRTTNAMNILGISEDLQYLIQSNIEDQAYQIQRMLANELDAYKERRNKYINDNIREIQDLYRNEEQKKKLRRGIVGDEEVILIKPYKVSTTTSKTTELSFIQDKVKNLEQYMKFVYSPMQMRLFKLYLHYQSLCSRGEQDSEFWMEIVVAFVEEKHNMETSQNGYPISMYQEGPPHEPYFISINN